MSGTMSAQTAATTSSNNYAGAAATAQAVAGIGQAYSEHQAGKYNARISRMNEAIQRQQSSLAIRQGEFGVNALRLKGRQLVGDQRAGFAGGNIRVDTGTAVDLANQTDQQVALDVGTLRENARLAAWGFDVGAADSRAKAQLATLEGNNRAAAAVGSAVAQASNTYRTLRG